MNKFDIRKILVISLTNIGDVILTFPVMDVLCRDFPDAELSVVIGPKAESLLRGNSRIKNVFIFDKHQSGLKKWLWVWALRKENFDLVVDLRNTAIPFLLSSRCRTRPAGGVPAQQHMKDKHLNRLRTVHVFDGAPADRFTLVLSDKDTQSARTLLKDHVQPGECFVVVGPSAADSAKRWPLERFGDLCRKIRQTWPVKIVFVGDGEDRNIAEAVGVQTGSGTLNLCGRTDLRELAGILTESLFVVVNDSGIMHLASYLDRPVVAVFGPSNPHHYGPWGRRSCFIKKGTELSAITVEDVWNSVEKIMKEAHDTGHRTPEF